LRKVLRLTTLPIPNQPGVLRTREITEDEAIEVIRNHFRRDDCVSHIGYQDTHQALERRLGAIIERSDRHVPPPVPGDSFVTLRSRGRDRPPLDCVWLFTEFTTK
jgi:hypothetical protein